jgi:DNA-binding NtrC family response regulator
MLKHSDGHIIENPSNPATNHGRCPAMTDAGTLAGKTIMIVEDDAALALDLLTSLTDAEAKVIGPITDLDEAARLVEGSRCDAVILDLRVGDRNATSFAHLLLQRRIPFLVYTGYPDSAYLELDWAGCRLLSKPADIECVMNVLSELLNWRGR